MRLAQKKRVTSYDVAAAAGVSRTTVSFVLNDTPNQSIPAATRTAVLHAAQTLGYAPSAAARMLRAGSSRLVLCLAPDWEPSALMDDGLARLTGNLRRVGYATVVAKSAEEEGSLDVLWQTISPAAVVAMFDLPADVRERIRALRVPLIEAFFHSFGSHRDEDELQVTTGRLQGSYVLDRGADRIVYVAQPPVRDAEIHSDRLRGVTAATAARGAATPELIELSTSHSITDDEIRLIAAGHRDRHTAVCCYNDLVALQVIQAAHRIGLETPRDLAVIGVDDEPFSALVSPSITTVRFDIPAHMAVVSQRILCALNGSTPPSTDQTAFSAVIPRESA